MMGPKPTWRNVRHLTQAWAHVHTSLAGKEDTATCTVCNKTVKLDPQPIHPEIRVPERSSILRRFARLHFNAHKLITKIPEELCYWPDEQN